MKKARIMSITVYTPSINALTLFERFATIVLMNDIVTIGNNRTRRTNPKSLIYHGTTDAAISTSSADCPNVEIASTKFDDPAPS